MYEVQKSRTEDRYTFAPLLPADRLDAHGEYCDPTTLQRAAWRYMDSGDRAIRLQHRRDTIAGRLVELVSWPAEHRAVLHLPGAVDKAREAVFPAGSLFAGVVWQPWAWRLIKNGDLRGLSLGGSARRVRTVTADFDPEAVRKALGSRRVASAAGSRRYGLPIGAPLVAHPYQAHPRQPAAVEPGVGPRSIYQPTPQISNVDSLLAALNAMSKVHDQQAWWAAILAAARRLGYESIVEQWRHAQETRTAADQSQTALDGLRHSLSATELDRAQTPSAGPPQRRRSGYLTPSRSNRRARPVTPGAARELVDGTTPPQGLTDMTPVADRHTGAWNQGGGHGERVHAPSGHVPDRSGGPSHRPAPRQVAKQEALMLDLPRPAPDEAVRDLTALAGSDDPAFQAAVAKARGQVEKAAGWQPHPEDVHPFPAPSRYAGDWSAVTAEQYERYRATGDLTPIVKSLADGAGPTAADLGGAWLSALADPQQMHRAATDYERQRRGLDPDDPDDAA